jgi:hypothetical protein
MLCVLSHFWIASDPFRLQLRPAFKQVLPPPHRDLVTPAQLHGEIAAKHLHQFQRVQVLGGREYVNRARTAFARYSLAIEAPLAGLRIGESMRAVQEAVDSGRLLA